MLRAIALVLMVVTMTSCQRMPPAAAVNDAEHETWRVVAAWNGTGSTQLEPFPIERHTWRVRWETKNARTPGAGTFYVTANSMDSGRVLSEVVEATGNDHDVAYITELPRRYYLVVTSSGVDWTMTAEEPSFE